MKTLFLISTFILIPAASFCQTSSDNLIASCCLDGRGCKGSAYCSACKNCTGCKHCAKNGGSCGVCSSGSNRTYTSYSKKSIIHASSLSMEKTYPKETEIKVVSTILNLREGPSTEFKILEKLSSGDLLIFLDSNRGWLKVRVKESNIIGYVYYKYVSEK